MPVDNRIVSGRAAAPQQKQAAEVSYEAGGETVRLSPALIRRYLVSGGGEVTDEEVMAFLSLCKFQRLNPFIKDAYLIKYGNTSAATIVVGKDVFIKRARAEKDFRGFTAGIILMDKHGDIIEREGAFWLKGEERLLGGWAKINVKGFVSPFYAAVALDDYIGKKKNGEINGQWQTKAATMIRKVALVQALRDAFPNLSGMYAAEERAVDEPDEIMADASEVSAPAPSPRMNQEQALPPNAPSEIIVETPIPQRDEAPKAQQTGQQYSFNAADPAAALFGGLQ